MRASSLSAPLLGVTHRSRRTTGVALIIVLAFVVLLTGLIVAFFSQAISERQISNSSASEVKVSLFADGAISSIVGDLKGEIVAGSTVPPNFTPPAGVTVYVPNAPADAVPQRVGTFDEWPSLVKTSTYDVANNQPAPFFVKGSTKGPARAVNLASDAASQNGRYISAARWNSHFLLPKKTPSSDTNTTPLKPAKDPSANTYVPYWVLVANDGTNPSTAAKFPSVVGRYAYAIYDEGGLLDINAAGFPLPANYNPPSVPAPAQYGYKASMALADLTQLTDGSTPPQPLLTADEINALVGRRNFVSASINPMTAAQTPLGGTFPAFKWTDTNLSNYFLYNVTDPSGFLAPTQLPQLGSNPSAYDRKVLTRQEMLSLMLRGLVTATDPAAAATQRARLQNALQYLTPYTRGLNQPSYAPVLHGASANLKPMIQGPLSGGNNAGDGTSATEQDKLNPNFLTLRAQAEFKRNDDTTKAIIGEPLVNTRFALQRLAWLTYKGPSFLRYQSNDTDIKALVDTYGISREYLKLGDKETIRRYFGLDWDGSKWVYDVHNRPATTAGAAAGSGVIRQLQEVADLKTREPDFFELLKGTIDAGSLAKASILNSNSAPGGQGYAPMNFQYLRDISVDAAILQIGANIIDQFDVDGYCTRISFDDGGGKGTREFRGVENLPYLYRIRTSMLKAREANPAVSQPSANGCVPVLHSMLNDSAGKPYPTPTPPALPLPTTTYKADPLTDTGAALLLALPDLWNPHDQNCSPGNPRPGTADGSVRVIADSATPDNIAAKAPVYNVLTIGTFTRSLVPPYGDPKSGLGYKGVSYGPTFNLDGTIQYQAPYTPSATAIPTIPYFTRVKNAGGASTDAMTGSNGGFINPMAIASLGNPAAAPAVPANSSILAFKIPDNTVFREPTMLAKVDPSGIGLKMEMSNSDVLKLQDGSGAMVYDNVAKGLKSVTANPLGLPAAPPATQLYAGIYLGAAPLRWVGGRWPTSDKTTDGWVYTTTMASMVSSPIAGVTYRVQYLDESNNWVTYDEKYVDTDPSWMRVVAGSLVQPGGGAFAFADPRTSRFGSPREDNIDQSTGTGVPHWRAPIVSSNWLDSTAVTLVTERPGIESGFGSNFRGVFGTNPDNTPAKDWGDYTALGWHYQNVGLKGGANFIFFQSGLLAQNDPGFASDGYRFHGDTNVGTGDPQFYADADGVVRRAMGAYVSGKFSDNPVDAVIGQPLATANTAAAPGQSRPIILNRPFRSVAELGYVFAGTPWKNLDFSTPESGNAALLDVFSIAETAGGDPLVAGRLDLNTRQSPVLKAMLAGAYTDEENTFPTGRPATSAAPLTADDANALAGLLVTRTSAGPKDAVNTTGPQPLANIGDLVGHWNGSKPITGAFTPAVNSPYNIDGKLSYDGFSADDVVNLQGKLSLGKAYKIPRLREAAVRSLASVGNTRVWNLMLDVVAQTGRYPAGVTDPAKFVVEGEQRCWAHIAIDRCTGQVIDSKLEVVKE